VEVRNVPRLVLHRNGSLTPPAERTLVIEVTGLPAASGEGTVTLEVETEHSDPDASGALAKPIPVWREERPMANASGATGAVFFEHTFSHTVVASVDAVATPTDYFRYRIAVTRAEDEASELPLELEAGFAFLMENEWVAALPDVREERTGAAPDELIVYYCDMFPFQRSWADVSTRMARRDVQSFVGFELVPQMVEAFRTQSLDWGFTWHEAWTSYRGRQDAERLSVALTDGNTWFHGEAPLTGNSRISLNVSGAVGYGNYTDLASALLSTFHHELFHNLQRSMNLHLAGDGRVAGLDAAWEFFSEGTAHLASSVGLAGGGSPRAKSNGLAQHPRPLAGRPGRGQQVALPDGPARAMTARYGASAANDVPSHSDADMTIHQLVRLETSPQYWRYLYEQCGAKNGDTDDPAAGMAIVRNALWALYSADIVDITSSTDILDALPQLMDRALEQTPSCPFTTFEESLRRFGEDTT
jgi:hypothetical protein